LVAMTERLSGGISTSGVSYLRRDHSTPRSKQRRGDGAQRVGSHPASALQKKLKMDSGPPMMTGLGV